jgi:hypothetical protein
MPGICEVYQFVETKVLEIAERTDEMALSFGPGNLARGWKYRRYTTRPTKYKKLWRGD